jgi:hypothetical protein
MLRRESAGVSLIRADYRQLREQMIDASYVTAEEVDADLARLDDEDFMMPSSILWSVWGQRPDAP